MDPVTTIIRRFTLIPIGIFLPFGHDRLAIPNEKRGQEAIYRVWRWDEPSAWQGHRLDISYPAMTSLLGRTHVLDEIFIVILASVYHK